MSKEKLNIVELGHSNVGMYSRLRRARDPL